MLRDEIFKPAAVLMRPSHAAFAVCFCSHVGKTGLIRRMAARKSWLPRLPLSLTEDAVKVDIEYKFAVGRVADESAMNALKEEKEASLHAFSKNM